MKINLTPEQSLDIATTLKTRINRNGGHPILITTAPDRQVAEDDSGLRIIEEKTPFGGVKTFVGIQK